MKILERERSERRKFDCNILLQNLVKNLGRNMTDSIHEFRGKRNYGK